MQKTTPQKFCVYKITNNNPYDKEQDFKGNSVRYKIINHKENKKKTKNGQSPKMFIYVLNNEYLVTRDKIPCIPDLGKDLKLELVDKDKEFPITEETLDLYRQWVKYHIYLKVVFYCDIHRYAYDYTIENQYSILLDTPKNKLNVGIRRIFTVDAEVLTDGTAYLSVDIKCEYKSKSNIYDLIRQNINVINTEVKCSWSSFGRTLTIKKILDTPIKDNIGNLNLINYWNNLTPWRLNNIDTNAPAVVVYDKSHKSDSYYISQSLFPVITREYIKIHDKFLSKKVDEYTKLSMGKRLEIIQSFLNALNYNGTVIDLTPVSVEEFGYNYYNINNDMPNLLIANNYRIGFKEKYKAFQYGFYRLPESPIVSAFMSYDIKAQESYDVVKAIQDYTKGIVNGSRDNWVNDKLLPLKFYHKSFHYKKGDKLT